MKTHAASLVLFLLWVPSCKGACHMIPNNQTSRGYIDVTQVAVVEGSHHATSAWLAAGAAGAGQFNLLDYATFNQPIFNNGQALVSPLPNADEVIVNIRNTGLAFPLAAGKTAVVQFAWSDGEGSTFYETGYDIAPASAITSAIVVGAQSVLNKALAVRRYAADVAEFQLEQFSGKSFRLVVKAPFLLIGVATIGAPDVNQVVMAQVLPRTIGPTSGN